MGMREKVTDVKEKLTKPPEYQLQKLEGLSKLISQNETIIRQNGQIINLLKDIKKNGELLHEN